MRILAFDTATPVSSVALLDHERIGFEEAEATGGRHGDVLLPRIQRALNACGLRLTDLDAIAVGLGPGSFTGLRVGIATAMGFGLALGVPLRGVVTLEALALDAWAPGRYCVPVMNAFRGEVFSAVYACTANRGLHPVQAPFVAAPDVAAERIARAAAGNPLWLSGDGLELYGPRIASALAADATLCFDHGVPHGRHVAEIALSGLRAEGPHAPGALEPMYLRDSDAKLPARPLSLG